MDFSKMQPDEASRAAAQDLGLPAEFFDRMWAKESARGTNMVSPKGARGHFQVMPREHGVMEKRLGRTLDPDNFADSLTMAHAMMRENLTRFKDPRAATAAYNGGWNPKRWDNPETRDYIATLWPSEQPAAGTPAGLGTAPASTFVQQAEAQAAEQARKENTGLIDVLTTAWKDPRVNGAWSVVEHMQKPDRDPSFSYYSGDYRKLEAGMQSEAELAFLRENSNSAEQQAWAVDQINQRREQDKVYGDAGGGATFAGQMVVGVLDPVGWLAGAGVGKAANLLRVGHAAFAARGAKAAAVGAMAAEGAAGNMLWEAIQDGMGESKTAHDYALAAGFGVAFSTLAMHGALKDAEVGRVFRDAEVRARDIEVHELTRKAEGMERMSPSEIGARQADEITAQRRAATRTIDSEDVAVPHDLAEELRRADMGEESVLAPGAAVVRDTRAVDADEVVLTQQEGVLQARVEDLQRVVQASPEDAPVSMSKALLQAQSELSTVQEQLTLRRAAAQAEAAKTADGAAPAQDLQGPATLQDGTGPKLSANAEGAIVQGESTHLRKALTDALGSPAALADPTARHVIQHLLDTFPKTLLDNTPVNFFENIRGRYRQLFNKIDAPGASGKTLKVKGPGNEARVLAHEAVHAATARMLRAVENHETGVPEVAKQAYQRLQDLRADVIAELEKRGQYGKSGPVNYATTNVDEFVAQVMSEPSVRSLLASMPGRLYEASNKLKTFVRAVFGLLGFNPKKVEPGSALEEAMIHIDTLINTQGNMPDDVTLTVNRSDLWARNTLTAQTDRNFAARMYDHANAWLVRNPTDPRKLEVLTQQALPKGSAVRASLLSDGLTLAASKNPVLRMMAGLVTEVTTGASGRRTTAAIKRDMMHQQIVGHGVVDYHHAYADFRGRNGGGHVDDFLRGDVKRRFDTLVMEEILARRYGNALTSDGAVSAAADALHGLFSRSLELQKAHSTLGSGLLPPDATGYVPQALNGDALASATAQELEELAQHFARHWQGVYGWSSHFAEPFSRVYIDRARKRANGASGVDFVATESPSAAVRDTLEEMRLNSRSLNTVAAAELDRVGAQPQNKKRLDVDLLATLPGGKRVLDFYHQDVEVLARQHANRVAGAAALADFNILGQRGVNNILLAVDLADPSVRAMPEEREALARVFSEFLGQPVKGEYRSKLAANAAGMVRVQRLGGLAFTQLSELANMTHHLGLGSVFKGLAALPQMVREVRDLKHGKTVSNAWLSSMESHQGFEFGMEGFNMVARLDPPDELLRAYGKGSDVATRAIAGLGHLQTQLSFFRGLHAAQHRAVAELILKKAISEISSMQGNAVGSKMLEDMGITPDLIRAIRGDLPRAVQRDASGNAIGFDITQLTVPKAQDDLLAAIHRGTGQIIQRTFIGERGAWAHNDVTKLMLQLRTFGLTAMEKQWGRTRVLNSDGPLNGYGYAAGVLLGQMAFALPIYLARAELYAAGREDRDEFLERATQPISMLTATMNYSALSGLAGDAFDMVASIGGGWSDDVKQSLGHRSYGGGVGSVVPVGGSIDAAWRVASGKADLHTALKQLPLSNLPMVAPIINLTAEDD